MCHFQKLLSSESVLKYYVKYITLQLFSLVMLQSWVNQRPKLGVWYLEHRQILTALYEQGNEIDGYSINQSAEEH